MAGIFKVDASSLKTQADIRSDKLRVYVKTLKSGGPWSFSVWSTLGAETWSEDKVTWNNGPSRKNKLTTASISSTGWQEFDVTAYLIEKLQEGDDLDAITFWLQGEDKNYERIEINSIRESNSNKPECVVTSATVAIPAAPAPGPPATCPLSSSPAPTPAGGSTLAPSPPEPAPSPSPQGGSSSFETITLTPTHDASMRQAAPDSPSNWGEVEAYAKQPNKAIVGIFKFDLSSLDVNSVVQDAHLQLYVKLLSPAAGANFSLWSTTGAADWDEATVTWNNGPRKDKIVSKLFIDGVNRYVSFDVTVYIATLFSAKGDMSRVTLFVKGDEENNEVFECQSIRKTNAYPPRLVLKTVESASPTSSPSPAPTIASDASAACDSRLMASILSSLVATMLALLA